MTNNKKRERRYYSVYEIVWIIEEQKQGKVMKIDTKNHSAIVEAVDQETGETYVSELKLWEIDKLKYLPKKKLEESKKKVTYFASVEGGVVPTKDEENGGRDCYARLDKNGSGHFELYIPKLTLAKIPLGFASYLNKEDILSLKHERSSVGSTGLINVSGLIDSTYQGEVILQVVPLVSNICITDKVEEKKYCAETDTFFLPYGKAICQAVVLRQSEFEDVEISYEDLLEKPSTRGIEGWGSTGK